MIRCLAASLVLFGISGDKVNWTQSYHAAISAARVTGKPVLCHLTIPVRTGRERNLGALVST